MAVSIHGDLPHLTPHLAAVPVSTVQNIALSPSGTRVVAEASGDIFTLPAEKGDTRNLTNTPGSAERDPAWSPDGKSIAYFSDASGRVSALHPRSGRLAATQSHRPRTRTPRIFTLSYGRRTPNRSRSSISTCASGTWMSRGGKPVKVDTGLRGGIWTLDAASVVA